MSETFVVVGAGLAAAHAVATIREGGFTGRLVVLGAEPHLPYERPPLSKGYLLGKEPFEKAHPHDRAWYDAHDVELRLGTRVDALDVAEQVAYAADDEQRYDRLLLATGATPRRLAAADDSGAPVAYLRTVEDSDRLRETLRPGARIAILGAGWIGLEVASAARERGAEVTVLESADLPLLRVLGPEVAEVFAGLHRAHGVDLRLGVQVSGVESRAGRAVVLLADGGEVDADLLLVGIGASPATALAEAAGLAVDNGILVDAGLRTSAPGVFAAGDVANAEHPLLGRRLRVEHWDNAIEQGKAAGRSMLGEDVSYDRLPYFFSDQYDLGLEYVGAVGPEGYDEVVLRGDVEGRVFTAFWVAQGTVRAGMHVNDWDAIDQVRRLVGSRVEVDRLRDGSVPLADV